MPKLFQKLSSQLFLAFISLSLLSLIQVYFNVRLNLKKERVENIIEKTNSIEVNAMEQIKSVNDFFIFETRDSVYFISGKSKFLSERKQLQIQFEEIGQNLFSNNLTSRIDPENHLKNLYDFSDSLETFTDSISSLMFKRGFKDYGMEGTMRVHAHNIENSNCIPLAEILMLRRHEKDYIIRNEQKYIDKYYTLINSIIKREKDPKCLSELNSYRQCFAMIVILDRDIGVKNNTALMRRLENIANSMILEVRIIKKECGEFKNTIYAEIQILSITITISIIILGFVLSVFLSRLVTRRIANLSRNISKFVENNFDHIEPIVVKRSDEISELIRNFVSMQMKIIDQINSLEGLVEERTQEINVQKEQILKQNKKLIESLNYAQNIQEAVLPSYLKLSSVLSGHLVYFRPKDLVSGDFYWFKNIASDISNKSVIVVGDCTGHGVPGGFMSMLGISSLNDVVTKKAVETSADILNFLREKIVEMLGTKVNGRLLQDGMDVGVAVIDHVNNTLQYSGAYRPLYYVRNNNIIKIKGQSMPIGRYYVEYTPFTYTQISIEKNDSFYMFTDGFTDQQNPETGKKYLIKNLEQFLLNISPYAMDLQKEMIDEEFHWWKNGAVQTDDILILGFKV